MVSLVTLVRNKFLEAIRSVNPPSRWKILVVDEHSQKLLGAVLKQYDILQENVTLIESISGNREPQPEFEAMYLLMPTRQNVERVIKDFEGRRQYSGAHLFFIEGLSEELFQRITTSSAEPNLRALKELFINFWASEAQVFSVQDPSLFFSIYSPPRTEAAYKPARDRLEEDLKFTSKIITNLCITLNEFPYVRYYLPTNHPPLGPLKPNAQTRPPPPTEGSSRWRTNLARGAEARAFESADMDFVTRLLAFMVEANLEEHKKNNPDFGKLDGNRPRGVLIITDRSMDMMAPFVHEFTYQAMAHDVLPITDGKYTYKFQSASSSFEDKTSTLSDADNVWTEVRHMHMREAIDKLMADFNKFLSDNAVFKGEGAANLNDMREMLANLPQYQEQREKFSLHLNMAQECMSKFEKDMLPPIANVEQCCSTGLNSQGKTPKGLVEEMVPLLDSREVSNINKVRIIALYIQYRDGVPDEDRRRLYQHARLSLAEQDAANALAHIGVRLNRAPNDKDRKKIKQKPSKDDEYELSRFKPALTAVIEDQISDKLETTLFPYVKDAPSQVNLQTSLRSPPPPQTTSLRSQKPAWHRAPKQSAISDHKQRIIVFMAGGMTYSEMREVYQLSESSKKEIIIGSTHMITPNQMVDDLKVLDLGGAGSKALPNGLRNIKAPRPFQEFYDEKYFTKDPPPPARPAATPVAGRPQVSAKSNIIQPSPTNSFQGSSYSSSGTAEDKLKKKKRNLFGF
ncbi:ras opposite [Coprinopsis marcescibilis]|uniref:Ras opposite n=1 Tax=Coprinopsis marcescibilis TaxID=230819 RepID=A0A5C3KZY6_COPMA|nr:ras opposite [Coprinopsis marcescibilis]